MGKSPRLVRCHALSWTRHALGTTKGCGSRKATLSMVFKLALEAEKQWRRSMATLNGHALLTDGEIKKGSAAA